MDNRKTTEKVLSFLENGKGGFISGGDMAEKLGISRNAVWKAVKELKNKGYVIESVSNKGYRLSEENDIISLEGIKACLKKENPDRAGEIIVYDCVDSTSNIAKELALKGALMGTCVVAGKQSLGRGRRDHGFFSPEGGIYMSVVLTPPYIRFSENESIIKYIGVSVCETIKELTGNEALIKGNNDIFIDGKKVCGILIESGSEFDSGTLQWLVVGIGINFDPDVSAFPEDLKNKATSLFKPGEANISKNLLIADILEKICDIANADEKDVFAKFEKLKIK